MAVPKQVSDCIARILKKEMRKGRTTKHGTTMLAMNEMRNNTDFGLPRAMVQLAAQQIVSGEVGRQLKVGLPDNVVNMALRNAPPEIVQVMPNLPAWIATSEGIHAQWVPSLQATAEQWRLNAMLKYEKAKQTESRANASADLANYLSTYGLKSLSDSMRLEPEAAE